MFMLYVVYTLIKFSQSLACYDVDSISIGEDLPGGPLLLVHGPHLILHGREITTIHLLCGGQLCIYRTRCEQESSSPLVAS